MSFRRTFLAFALCVGAPTLAAAQQSRQVEIGYEITFAGITGFRIDATARLNGNAYDVESHTYKEGILRAVSMQYVGRNRGWGTMTPEGAQPRAGSMALVVGDKTRTFLAQYLPDGSVQDTQNPEWKPTPAQSLTAEQRHGALDPMTAALSAVLAGCDVYTRRVAGEFYDAPSEAESQRDRPMKIWLARLDDSRVRYPAKLEAQTGFGTIRGKTLFFRERSLTAPEIAAMPR